MAAARHVLVMCGEAEIDGHAFCLGLDNVEKLQQDPKFLVTNLMRDAVFRPRHVPWRTARLALDICPLGELIDMFHTHDATERVDKVYALLGMSNDDPLAAGLTVDYRISWSMLMQKLVSFIIGHQATVKTWHDKELALVRSRGCVLGVITRVELGLKGQLHVQAYVDNKLGQGGWQRALTKDWTVRTRAKAIQEGDFICLLEGAQVPSVLSLQDDFLIVTAISIVPPDSLVFDERVMDWQWLAKGVDFNRNFLLFWDWGTTSNGLQLSNEYRSLMKETFDSDPASELQHAAWLWHTALIMNDAGYWRKSKDLIQKAASVYFKALEQDMHNPVYNVDSMPVTIAYGNEENIAKLLVNDCLHSGLLDHPVDTDPPKWESVVRSFDPIKKRWHLLRDQDYRANLEFGETLLQFASRNISEESFRDGPVDISASTRQTTLRWALENGYNGVTKLLLDSGINVDVEDFEFFKPLELAIHKQNMVAVRLLLDATVEMDTCASSALTSAAREGNEELVRMMIDAHIDVNRADECGLLPLPVSVEQGHPVVVTLLLNAGADANVGEKSGSTPLHLAAKMGHTNVVKALLTAGAKADPRDVLFQTPLAEAALHGHSSVVKILHDAGAEPDSRGCCDATPLSGAAWCGSTSIVKMLLDVSVEVDSEDFKGKTSLLHAAEQGHAAVVGLLLDASAKVDHQDQMGRTALLCAATKGHAAVARLLLDASADVNHVDVDGRTPLLSATFNGHTAVVRLLLDALARVNCAVEIFEAALSVAQKKGHVQVIEQLSEVVEKSNKQKTAKFDGSFPSLNNQV